MSHPFYQTSEEAKKTIDENEGKSFIYEETTYTIIEFELLDMSSESSKQCFNDPENYPTAVDEQKYILICQAHYTNTEDEDEPFQIMDPFIFLEIANNILL
ncbi:hypothetical protein [Flavobacterium sp. UBA7682]|uniref:hypothetical protein n=1 Tax=Flavobacterium sp. UBA7682 TaxID=1946560 RepID=UPI0025C6CC51|nr:hypothetical protein [Flavobacterium sp. UBA7682]